MSRMGNPAQLIYWLTTMARKRLSAKSIFLVAMLTVFVLAEPLFGQFTTIINIPPDPSIGDNEMIGSNTQLNLSEGGEIGHNFSAGDPFADNQNIEVNITGGAVGFGFTAFNGSVVNISGGLFADFFNTFQGSRVNVTGGNFGIRTFLRGGSITNISGGTFKRSFHAEENSLLTITGGSFGYTFNAYKDSKVNIGGGEFVDFYAVSGSKTNLWGGEFSAGLHVRSHAKMSIVGSQFTLDGVDITDDLLATIPYEIDDRDVTLSGVLSDGTAFSFDLNSVHPSSITDDFFDLNAYLTVTLAPPGDFTGEGKVTGADFMAWARGYSPNAISQQDLQAWSSNFGVANSSPTVGDLDENLSVNGADFLHWARYDVSSTSLSDLQANFGHSQSPVATSQVIPEPTSAALLLLAGGFLTMRRRR